MGAKVNNDQIIEVIRHLNDEVLKEFRERGFQDNFNPGHRRQTIQDKVKEMYGISYSDGGFRGRLKTLVKNDVLRKFRIGEGMHARTYYKIKNPDETTGAEKQTIRH